MSFYHWFCFISFGSNTPSYFWIISKWFISYPRCFCLLPELLNKISRDRDTYWINLNLIKHLFENYWDRSVLLRFFYVHSTVDEWTPFKFSIIVILKGIEDEERRSERLLTREHFCTYRVLWDRVVPGVITFFRNELCSTALCFHENSFEICSFLGKFNQPTRFELPELFKLYFQTPYRS